MLIKTKKEVSNLHDKELLESLADNFITAILDADGIIIDSNAHFSKVFPASNSGRELQASQLLRSLVNSRALYWEICKTLQAGSKWKGVLFHKGLRDKTYCLETSIIPVNGVLGNVVKYVAISNNLSDAYCNEISSNTIYNDEKLLLESLTKGALFITKQGKIFNTSQNSTNNTYHSIIGANIYDFINPANHEFLGKQIHTVFTKGKVSKYQSITVSYKGSQTFFVTKIKPVFNLQNEVVYATLKSKKYKDGLKINKALKAIETKYTNIFHSINVGIIVVANSQGNIIEWNKGAEKAFGYTDTEIIGKHLTVIVPKRHLDTGIAELRKAKDRLDNDLSGASIEMIGLKKSGEEFPVDLTMSHWENGKERFYCATMLDVSKSKKLEDKLRKTTKDLELFLYRSAHDLKAPLTSAEGLLLLLKDEKINKRASALVSMIDDTLRKGRLLLDDLAFASIISEKSREIAPILFEDKISKAMIGLKEMKNYDDIDFQIDIQQKTEFHFNQELMDCVFQNLMHNAVCFAKPKSSTSIPSVNVSVEVSDKEVKITVSDNGLGIDSEHLDKVFDLYFRVCNENSNGTGLGLYILKRIVEVFQGEVSVTSQFNQGTSFEVLLPNLKEENLNDD